MKKLILSVVLSISIICSFGQSLTQYIVNAGGSIVIDPSDLTSDYVLKSNLAPMSGDFEISLSSTPPNGTVYRVWLALDGVDISTHDIIVFGVPLQDIQTTNKWGFFTFIISSGFQLENYVPRFDGTNFGFDAPIEGDEIAAGTLPLDRLHSPIPLTSMDTLGRGRIIYGKASNVMSSLYAAGNAKILVGDGTDLNSVAVSGDIGITNAGVSSISSGVIVNADVNSAAAIAFSKMAALTASKAVVTNSSGVITTANQLSAALGGTAQDFSASTGFQTWSAGTASVGTITESESFWVSFESGYQCDNKIKMPCAGTVTGLYAYAVKAVAGTDNGTIVAKNAAGTTMTSGTITFTASDPQGTAYTSTPSANNTFSAGDILYFTTAKTTAGGVIELTVTYTRSN